MVEFKHNDITQRPRRLIGQVTVPLRKYMSKSVLLDVHENVNLAAQEKMAHLSPIIVIDCYREQQ